MTSTTPPRTSATKPSLTTIFTPPANCFARTYTLTNQPGSLTDFTSIGSGTTLTVYRGITPSCYPSQATFSDGWFQFSAGLCPSGYSLASLWSDGISFTRTSGQCCPWNMRVSSAYYDCGTYPTPIPVVLSGAGENGDEVITTSALAFDTPIGVAWEAADLTLLERNPTALGSWNVPSGVSVSSTATGSSAGVASVSATVTGSGGVSAAETTGAVVQQSGKNEGLGTGAKAGLAIGIVLGVLLVAALTGFLLWRRRKAKKAQQAGGANGSPRLQSEMSRHEGGGAFHQIDESGQIYETSGESKIGLAEAEGDTKKLQELDAQEAMRTKRKSMMGGTAELEGDSPGTRRY